MLTSASPLSITRRRRPAPAIDPAMHALGLVFKNGNFPSYLKKTRS